MVQRRTWIGVAAAVTWLAALGWGQAALAGPAPVSYATVVPGANGLLMNIIRLHRLDEMHGILLDLKAFTPAEAEKAMYFRKVEVGTFAPISALRVNVKGERIRLIAPLLWNTYSVLARRDSPYQRLEDLKGKKFGVPERITGGYTSMALVVRMLGMDLEKDFRLIIGTPVGLITFLQRGEVDAILQFDPLVSRLLAEGTARELVRPNDLWKQLTGGDMFMIGHAVHEDWLKANPDRARRLARTMLEGARYVAAHPEAVEEAKKFLGPKSETELRLLKERMPRVYATRWDRAAIENAKLVMRKSMEFGLVERAPDQLLDEMFVPME